MNKHFKVFLPIIFSVLIIAGMFLGLFIAQQTSYSLTGKKSKLGSSKLDDIIQLIQYGYVDKVDEDELIDMAVSGLLEQLDPHSVYIPAEHMQSVNEEIDGKFEGIGVQFTIRHDTVMVIKVIPGGPSEKGGILAGDRIVAVDGESIAGVGITNEGAMKKLKGPGGTTIKLSIYRKERKGILQLPITRGVIKTQSVNVAYMYNATTAYIKLTAFAANTYTEMVEELKKMKKLGMKNLILDLRGNSGGLLEQAIYITNEFLGKGDLIVYTMGKSGRKNMNYANGRGKYKDVGLAVLIDEFSASASEILAGAIQDNDRGWIVGRRSFGKGLVQQQVPLPDGSALRLTTERYYTPAGRSIQKPYSHNQEEYYSELMTRYLNGGLDTPDSSSPADSLKVFTLKKKRAVYGGGGIMPDIFIPIGKKHESQLFKELRSSGLIYEFASEYADQNRSAITKMYGENEYIAKYKIGKQVEEELKKFVTSKGISTYNTISPDASDMIGHLMKGVIARDLYGENAFYRILNSKDDAVIEAATVVGKKL